MAASYPSAAKTFTAKSDGDTVQAAHMTAVEEEIAAVEAALLGTQAHDVKLAATKHFYEAGAATHLGEWSSVAFDADNFTASGSMTWTVAEADVTTYAWTLVGNTLTLSFAIAATTVAGTPSTELRIALPGELTATKAMYATFYYLDNSTRGLGYCLVSASGTYVSLFKSDFSNWTAATNATSVFGTFTFEVA